MDVQLVNLQRMCDVMSTWTKISKKGSQAMVEYIPLGIKATLTGKGGQTQYWQGVTDDVTLECMYIFWQKNSNKILFVSKSRSFITYQIRWHLSTTGQWGFPI